jgi:predicted tellurium resistance membrane protein TerC
MKIDMKKDGTVIVPEEDIKRLKILLKEARQVDAFAVDSVLALVAMALNKGIGELESEVNRKKLATKYEEMKSE